MSSPILPKPCRDTRHHIVDDLLQLYWFAAVPRLDRNALHDGSQMARQTSNLIRTSKGPQHFRNSVPHGVTPHGRVTGERGVVRVTCDHAV